METNTNNVIEDQSKESINLKVKLPVKLKGKKNLSNKIKSLQQHLAEKKSPNKNKAIKTEDKNQENIQIIYGNQLESPVITEENPTEIRINNIPIETKEENLDTIQNEENNIDNNELNKKTNKKNKKLFIKPNIENLLMEATQHKINTDFRKFKFNGITVVQDLKDYFPKDITKDEVKELLLKAFGDGIVDDIKYYIPGKTVTKNQVNDIVNLVFDYIKEDLKMDDIHNANVLPGVNLIIDLVDLDRDIIRNKMFKGIEPTEIQLENTMKNLNGGLNYVKLLSIEFSE